MGCDEREKNICGMKRKILLVDDGHRLMVRKCEFLCAGREIKQLGKGVAYGGEPCVSMSGATVVNQSVILVQGKKAI